jgi:hypothetical protein
MLSGMCWQCDHPGSTRADYLNKLRSDLEQRAWMVQYVEDERLPFAYTIGLHPRGLPELLVTAVSTQRALRILNSVADAALRGEVFRPGELIELEGGPLLEVVQVDHPDAHMGMAIGLYGPQVRALQLVWTDGRGRGPWSADFCDGRSRQPVLGVRARARR